MYYRNEVIRYLQSNNILALKLDHALAGVENAVADQIALTGAGAKRALYYASCFTDEYQDVCQRQKMKMDDLLSRSFTFFNMAMLFMKCSKYILKKYLNIKRPLN